MHFEKKIMCVSYKIVLPHDRSTKTNCVDSKFHVSDIEKKDRTTGIFKTKLYYTL